MDLNEFQELQALKEEIIKLEELAYALINGEPPKSVTFKELWFAVSFEERLRVFNEKGYRWS